ncbi:MAG: ribosome maturation factor RimM [Gammaproteobacteria bacterium]|nr:ribosome maturation factor RimM [Gammaproteobacteria bacterium]MBU1724082.1 ribosome maturation factor RimM [Gammaproteobacteria bacterium]MBU2006842.1 ribosome maturation factor RimM [Gammaproteobacteria bacterium]
MSIPEMVTLGKVSGVFGVKGWVKVFSYTSERDGILSYEPWFLKIAGEWEAFRIAASQSQAKGIVVLFEGMVDRDQAQTLIGCEIAVPREQLRNLGNGEYYWTDLIGLDVVTTEGIALGKIGQLFETGSNDVMVVNGDRERLLPWIMNDVVKAVSLEENKILVDWDPEF